MIELIPAQPQDFPRIENLMQFYNYELSDTAAVDFADHGLYQLQPKAQYWAQHLIAAFLIYVDGKLAGFAVVDNEVLESASQFNMGYFFVARRYRGQGVGRVVAAKLMAMFPGRWEIYHLAQNQSAGQFWRASLIADGRGGVAAISNLRQKERPIYDEPCIWFGFDTTSASA